MHPSTRHPDGPATSRAAPDPDDASASRASAASDSLRSFRRYTYWSLVGAGLLVLLLPIITGPVPLPPDAVGTVAALGALVVVGAVMRLVERHVPRTPDAALPTPRAWRTWVAVGGLGSVATATALVLAGDEVLWAFAPAMIVSLLIACLPRRWRGVAVVASIAVAAAVGVLISLVRGDDPTTAFPIGGAVVTGFVLFLTLATIWTWDIAVQLDTARRTAATLAVTNERLRFASELHDIQGHHLQVIALKSELAGRLLRSDPSAAEREITAVQQLAADALRDTRAVVHGYRNTTFDAEISNASNVLASAGIDASLHVDDGLDSNTLPETTRHLLGLVLREAVTNILRHSTASGADVRLTRDGDVTLSVSNDGAEGEIGASIGGLGHLAERLRAAGGSLTWHRSGNRFEVRACLPGGEPPAVTRPGSEGSA